MTRLLLWLTGMWPLVLALAACGWLLVCWVVHRVSRLRARRAGPR